MEITDKTCAHTTSVDLDRGAHAQHTCSCTVVVLNLVCARAGLRSAG